MLYEWLDILPKFQSANNPPAEPAKEAPKPAAGGGFKLPNMHDLRLPKMKYEIKEAKWPAILSAIILILAAVIWLTLFLYNQSLAEEEKALDAKIADLKSQENKVAAQKIKTLEGVLKSAKDLLDNHTYSSQVFEVIENNTLPNVQFTSFSFDSQSLQVSLGGRAQTYNAIARQILIFSQEQNVKDVKVSKVSLDQLGGAGFDMAISLDEKMLKR